MEPDAHIIDWLLSGDVSIKYQVQRDLLDNDDENLRNRIANEGWGAAFLAKRHADGHWGQRYYQPKWISSHYTLLDLKNLGIAPDTAPIRQSIQWMTDGPKGADGSISPFGKPPKGDVCVNGMFLNFASYFGTEQDALKSVVDFLLAEHMPDGGFNCFSNSVGAVHSSLHSTISCLEGIEEYLGQGYQYRADDLASAVGAAQEFILLHRLFRSDHTGQIISKKMLMLSYPSRWKYDILRALDFFRKARFDYDTRMDDAIAVLLKKRRKDGRWPLQAKHPGQVHFDMEKVGKPSRWNTLRALRVLRCYGWDSAERLTDRALPGGLRP